MACQRGGFIIQRHNELRALEAEMLATWFDEKQVWTWTVKRATLFFDSRFVLQFGNKLHVFVSFLTVLYSLRRLHL